MYELIEIVIPKIKAEWETLAYSMRYQPSDVKGFRGDSQDFQQCCKELFINWITTDHGPKPKTYQTLLNHIKKIENLLAVSESIKKELIQGRYKEYSVFNFVQSLILSNFTTYFCYYSSAQTIKWLNSSVSDMVYWLSTCKLHS